MISLRQTVGHLLAGGSVRRMIPRKSLFAAASVVGVGLGLVACGDDQIAAPRAPVPASASQSVTVAPLPALIEEPVRLSVPTYEGSGESVHPDVVEFPLGWNGARYWLTMTPYPRSESKVENPSILVGANGVDFTEPAGLRNPVIPHRGRPSDYNSDPELVYEAETGRLVLFYRFVDRRTNTILATSSIDGRTWNREPKAFWAHGHAAVSPTIAARTPTAPARIWYVDAGKGGCKAPSTRVMMRSSLATDGRLAGARWSEPVPTDLAQPGYVIWHMKVRYVPSKNEYWAIYAAYPEGRPAGCEVDDLFFARSSDGVHWETFREPLLRHEDRAWTASALYRSSFLYDPVADVLSVWVSARSDEGKWGLGLARFRYSRLLVEISTQATARRSSPFASPRFATAGEAP